ncbi:MAG: M28 family peptidase [Fimbriimonas sp.]
MTGLRFLAAGTLFTVAFAAPALRTEITTAQKTALDRISADSLQAHVSFLASDALEGRGTPSRGLDIAAEYIASQFRRAGLEPAVSGSYFQTTMYKPRNSEKPEEKVQNVIGVLRGSDPKLKDTYILVTAHYDHLGIRGTGEDKIFNGANDDASGTASVMEVASALKGLKPRRSIVFMTFWGEEHGLLGSQYYGKNPVFPIDKTIGMVNLEQVGRTDDTEGARVGAVSITGFDFSDMSKTFEAAGKVAGIQVQKHPQFSDQFFVASDNAALALQGIPAHTICTAFMFPDYHKAGDHWDKLDYANMAKVNKMVAMSVMMLGDSDKEPQWDDKNPKTAKFREARRASRGG